jgi:hypothetical protein
MKARTNSKDSVSRRFADPRIIEFKPKPRPGKRKDPPIVDPLRQLEIEEGRLRVQQNIVAAIVLALLLAAGLWLIHELRTSSRTLTCIQVGYHNCLPNDRQWVWTR